MTFLKLFLLSMVIFFPLDLLWIGGIAKNFYKEQIGFLMAKDVKWGAALLFYFMYLMALVVFVILPAFKNGSGIDALLYGAFFGFICYATYDLTNLATLKDWPLKLTIVDMIWGTALSAITSYIVFTIAHHWRGYFS